MRTISEAYVLANALTCFWGLWCKSQSALAFVADSVRERPVSRAFWQKQISTLLFQLNDLHQNPRLTVDGFSKRAAGKLRGCRNTEGARTRYLRFICIWCGSRSTDGRR